MKRRDDPRHLKRAALMQLVFEWQFNPKKKFPGLDEIVTNMDKIDKEIEKAAPSRPLSQTNKIDLAILRISIFELIMNDTPPKVVADEAVELAKEYGGDSSSSFVNGALGKVLEGLKK